MSYLTFIALIVASSYFSIAHLKQTKFLSEYDATAYARYIRWIYQNPELKAALNQLFDKGRNNSKESLVNCDISLRFVAPNPFQIAIFVWVIGFAWHEFKQIAGTRMRVYLASQSKSTHSKANRSLLS